MNIPRPLMPLAHAAARAVDAGSSAWEFVRDYAHFERHRAQSDRGYLPARGPRAVTQLTKDYHRVEKGLAMTDPKRPFGARVEERLRATIARQQPGDVDEALHGYAASALAALDQWNEGGSHTEDVAPLAPALVADRVDREFFTTRYSLRNFDPATPVEDATLEEIVTRAIHTPSVCNRQGWRAHVLTGRDQIDAALRLQNGNRGFGDRAPALAIITADTRMFAGPQERNQRWVDGGLFAMSFVWAAHSLGVGTCMLNWSQGNARSARLRSTVGIDAHESIICMVALGYPVEGARRARSPRRGLSEVLVRHDAGAEQPGR